MFWEICSRSISSSLLYRQLNGLISSYELVKTNVLSLVCNKLQGVTAQMCEPWPDSTAGRIVRLVRNLALTDTGHKVLRIKMQTLAELTCDTRLNVSQTLNRWQREGTASIRRGVVEFPNFSQTLNIDH